ncbi:toxin-antitoxin system TumE family protein [Paenibacillus koleovorans]|uniref:toxin-antitoxin system TumE family protein n=1 Tax=Paenibacillus koleovorans TaxID=121608 RepID=UPI000FDB03AB|nr:DUF6516 family protein [Paenibacillus koleovorans]
MNGNPKSDLRRIHRELNHGIHGEIRDTDRSGASSTMYIQRATITFNDFSKLYVTEYLNKSGTIDKYYYDWEDASSRLKAQYHSESHEQDRRYQTITEPYHIHPPKDSILSNMDRFPNYSHQDLYSIVEGIVIFAVIPTRPTLNASFDGQD